MVIYLINNLHTAIFIVSLSGPIYYSIMGTHPLNLVLYITLTTFFLGILGFRVFKIGKG